MPQKPVSDKSKPSPETLELFSFTVKALQNLADRADKSDKIMESLLNRTIDAENNLKNTSDNLADTRRDVGGVTRRLGKFVEILTVSDKLIESINTIDGFNISPSVVDYNRKRRFSRGGGTDSIELDGLFIDDKWIIAVETKSFVSTSDVTDFYNKLRNDFFEAFPEYIGKTVIAVIASVRFVDSVRKLAAQKGLLAIEIDPPNVKMLSDKNQRLTHFKNQ